MQQDSEDTLVVYLVLESWGLLGTQDLWLMTVEPCKKGKKNTFSGKIFFQGQATSVVAKTFERVQEYILTLGAY